MPSIPKSWAERHVLRLPFSFSFLTPTRQVQTFSEVDFPGAQVGDRLKVEWRDGETHRFRNGKRVKPLRRK